MQLPHLAAVIEAVPAYLLLFPGALYLFFGWQVYRVTLALTSGLLGATVGAGCVHALAINQPAAVIVVIALVVVSAALSVPFKVLALFLLGGLAGLVLLMIPGIAFETEVAGLFWAILAFLAGGSCVVVFVRPMVIVSTAILGSAVLLRSLAVLLYNASPRLDEFTDIARTPIFLAVFLALSGLGVLCQFTSAPRAPAAPSRRPPPPLNTNSLQ